MPYIYHVGRENFIAVHVAESRSVLRFFEPTNRSPMLVFGLFINV